MLPSASLESRDEDDEEDDGPRSRAPSASPDWVVVLSREPEERGCGDDCPSVSEEARPPESDADKGRDDEASEDEVAEF